VPGAYFGRALHGLVAVRDGGRPFVRRLQGRLPHRGREAIQGRAAMEVPETAGRGAAGGPAAPPRDAATPAHLHERLRQLERANRALEKEVIQQRLSEELARAQTRMLIRSLDILAAEPNLDRFLGHVLKVTVQQLNGVGGTLWFPDRDTAQIRLHLEYLDGRVVAAPESRHPAVRHPPPVGGKGVSTFPTARPETYVLSDTVAGMPEENRAYIYSLGVRTLLTVPMMLGKETIG
jgi:hypothetical protein